MAAYRQVVRVRVVPLQFQGREKNGVRVEVVVFGSGLVGVQVGSIKALPLRVEPVPFLLPGIPVIQEYFFALGNVPGGHEIEGDLGAVVGDVLGFFVEKLVLVARDAVFRPLDLHVRSRPVVVDVVDTGSVRTQGHPRFRVAKAIVQEELLPVGWSRRVSGHAAVRARPKVVHVKKPEIWEHQQGRSGYYRAFRQVSLCECSCTRSVDGRPPVHDVVQALAVFVQPVQRTGRGRLQEHPEIFGIHRPFYLLPRKIGHRIQRP
mmetsp:Transcript_9092/g.19080  ORF Transcript_9092/g.19080 Transcript_9092/m.19080 type:complete len:262 (-) Transcript_9092:225-1010(-)